MFNSLSGPLTGRGPGLLYLSTGGVEWEMEVSGFTLRDLAHETDARVFTYLYHREDQMRLYGFSGETERRVFLELLKVSGIGPRAALKILSAASPAEIARLLQSEDVDGLSRLPGIGKKTAQKLILTLRGTLVTADEAVSRPQDELVDALTEMGFDRTAAAKAVTRLQADCADLPPDAREKEVFRRAIVELSAEG